MSDYIKPGKAASMLNVSYETLRRWWLAGDVPTIRTLRGNVLVSRWWVESQPSYTGKKEAA